MASFDATLAELASEKLRMEAECLAVDARLLAGRQELAILQECQVGGGTRPGPHCTQHCAACTVSTEAWLHAVRADYATLAVPQQGQA